MAIQVYTLTSNAEEAEVEWFYEDLQDLLKLTPTNNEKTEREIMETIPFAIATKRI